MPRRVERRREADHRRQDRALHHLPGLDDRDHDRVEGDAPEVDVFGHHRGHVQSVAEKEPDQGKAEPHADDAAGDGEQRALDVDDEPGFAAAQAKRPQQSHLPSPVQHRHEHGVQDGQGHDDEEDDMEGPVAPVVELQRRGQIGQRLRPSHHLDPGGIDGGARLFQHRIGEGRMRQEHRHAGGALHAEPVAGGGERNVHQRLVQRVDAGVVGSHNAHQLPPDLS